MNTDRLKDILSGVCVIPILTVETPAQAVQACEALQRGGLGTVEITLRTPDALQAIRAVKEALPGLQVAAGTVLNLRQLDAALEAGSDFCVSPGLTSGLLRGAGERDCLLLPGVASASEVMRGLDAGFSVFKLFPALAIGGVSLLRSLAGPFPDVLFCPTGGVTRENMPGLLAEPNVLCCGGSWMVSAALIERADWGAVETAARAASVGALQ